MEFTSRKIWPQYLLTFLCNIGTLSFGFNIGWLSPLQPSLTSDETPLGKEVPPLTTEQISWIGAIPAVSFLIGTPIYGYVLQKVGRKLTSLLATIPNIVCFTILLSAFNVYMIYAARFICGFASAGFLIVTPSYVNEATTSDVRGFLCSLTGLFINAGVITASILGAFTSYVVFNAICLSFSLIYLVFYLWLPESPVYLLSVNKQQEAKDSLAKLRGGNKEEIDREVAVMYKMVQENKTKSSSSIRHLVADRASRYALFIVIGVMSVQQLCGISAVLTYTVYIFNESGSSLSPFLAATLTNITQLIGSSTGAYFIDRRGRKSLLMTSTLIMSMSLSLLACFIIVRKYFLKDITGVDWIPTVALQCYIFFYAIGFGTVPFIIVPELFRPESRGIAAAVQGTWVGMIAFMITKYFPVITETISMAGSFSIFAISAATGSAFIYFVVFETKGKSQDEILKILKSRSEYFPLPVRSGRFRENIELVENVEKKDVV